jgi:GT2 family glycosyltransferase
MAAVTVVIPTNGRSTLNACIAAISPDPRVEIVVVDDAAPIPVTIDRPDVTVLRHDTPRGPAAARNTGLARATGDIVLLTDDDTIPSTGWAPAAIEYLAAHPEVVGATGPVTSRPWDPLYERSVQSLTAGQPWTCNIAYRTAILRRIGGFDDRTFTHLHGEDLEVALRAARYGPIGFAPKMSIEHVPRRLTVKYALASGRRVRQDLALYELHPQLTADFKLPPKVALVIGAATIWLREWRPFTVRRLLRALAFAAVSCTAAAFEVLRT